MNHRAFPRKDRVAGSLRREVARLLREELYDPRVGFVTVLEVLMSDKLADATVFVSVFPETKAQETLKILNQAAGYFRTELAKSLRLRLVPRLHFVYDDSLLKGNRIEAVIAQATAVSV